ncbi:MAG TPA: hypothetical protein VGJ15_05520, partial [Pirellulales bacterium]
LSQEISRLREDIAERVTPLLTVDEGSGFRVQDSDKPALPADELLNPEPRTLNPTAAEPNLAAPIAWLQADLGIDEFAASQAVRYTAAQVVAIGMVPTLNRIVFERFFDEAGGMQLVVHAPWGARINRAWGLAFRKRFCRSFDFELQASADEDGIVLSLGPQHSFPIESLFGMLTPDNGRYLLEQALLAAPVFQTRWRWCVTRALTVLRNKHGQRVPPNLQRFRSDDLLAAVFPAQAGCLENHHGDTKIPDHPLIHQTVEDCLHEAMDIDRWIGVLAEIRSGKIELIAKETREPSPFSHEILNANPYAFLDDAPLEERRARAVTLRRGLSFESASDLGRLDPEAIAQVRAEAWPLVRDAEELHDTLNSMCLLGSDEALEWAPYFEELCAAKRALRVDVGGLIEFGSRKAEGGDANSEGGRRKAEGELEILNPKSEILNSSPLHPFSPSPLHPDQRLDTAATAVPAPHAAGFWTVSERWPMVKTLYPEATAEPNITLPDTVRQDWDTVEAIVTLVRGRMQTTGPITADELGAKLSLEPSRVFAALEAIEAEGTVMRGYYTPESEKGGMGNGEWGVGKARLEGGIRNSEGESRTAESRRQNAGVENDSLAQPLTCAPAHSASIPHSQFPIPQSASPSRHPSSLAPRLAKNVEWCERRLLARIHRKTLDGLRRQIQPVGPHDFIRFLTRWHHLTPGSQMHGRVGLRKTIAQLQGFELAAGLWERRVLPARSDEYEPRWLDELSMSGELAWGRLCPPKKDADEPPTGAGLTRAAPISLLLRENLGWLLPGDRPSAEANCRGGALLVLDALRQRGALFPHELMALTSLLPSQLDEALHELAALGLVTADAFTAVRTITGSATDRRRAEKRRRNRTRVRREFTVSPSGRWSLFPGIVPAIDEQQTAIRWAWQLLRRYGVMFRDLLERESATPPWHRLVQVYRRLEARGEIRGGRFVGGVAGEQYALPEAVELVRSVRDEPPEENVLVLAAADPVNLCGIITAEPRIASTHTNTVAIQNGRLIAAFQSGEVQWFADLSAAQSEDLPRRLRLQHHAVELAPPQLSQTPQQENHGRSRSPASSRGIAGRDSAGFPRIANSR